MDQIRLRAMAKVNLGLDVIRRQEDGYHQVRMIMQTVNLYDKILIKRKVRPGIKLETNLFYLPVNENNLVYKAAQLLQDEFSLEQGLFIQLKKYIPVSAGMAGGSTDAAAVLYGMNRMFRLGLSRQELMERGIKLGADVPYCLMRGTVLAEGIGEKLTPLPPAPQCYVLLVKPQFSVSTQMVYEKLDADNLQQHPDIDGLINAIKANDFYAMAHKMENVLETVTVHEYPEIEEIKKEMKKKGAVNTMMTGSGPTVFGLYSNQAEAKNAYRYFKQRKWGKQVYLTDFFNTTGGKNNE